MVIADQLPPHHLPLLTFEGFTFDPARGVLTAEAREVVLRPKTTAVLAHLLAHAGQVVSRDALLTAVWGDVAVTDDSLTQCISEIRRALGPSGTSLLRTHARRGYMMATRSRPVVPAANPAPPLAPGSAADVLKPASNLLRSRLAWVALVVAGCGLGLSVAALMGAVRAPDPAALDMVAPGDLSPWAQARQLLAEGRLAQQGAEPFPVRLRASLPLFIRALELDPSLADAAAEASFVHTNLRSYNASQDPAQDLREAERLAALALAAKPDASMALAAQAAVLRQQSRFAEAIVFYERAGRPVDRANIGIIHLLLGDAEAALPWLRAALQERPLHEFAGNWQVYLGLAKLMTGQPDQAAYDFLAPNGDSRFPLEERLLYRLVALHSAGRFAEAEALNADLRQRDRALLARPLRALSVSDEAAYRARFASAVLEPLHRMGWDEVGR
ncbi:winged helix-turn-helix domain-containing protein [Roseomonas sp. CAU 1739]|uniref:winged helix-turn-helix domain-containing protein n=1 Tax=Roseomonas sp. CAU 1739 TaxID=3140364 RepID=UPI00325BC521